MATKFNGFSLIAKSAIENAGMNIKVANSLTGAEIKVGDNGIGGLYAEMKNSSINEVRIWNANGGMGYYIRVEFNQTGKPYNIFAIDGSGKKV